jgi:hypothetical protein
MIFLYCHKYKDPLSHHIYHNYTKLYYNSNMNTMIMMKMMKIILIEYNFEYISLKSMNFT